MSLFFLFFLYKDEYLRVGLYIRIFKDDDFFCYMICFDFGCCMEKNF